MSLNQLKKKKRTKPNKHFSPTTDIPWIAKFPYCTQHFEVFILKSKSYSPKLLSNSRNVSSVGGGRGVRIQDLALQSL